MTIVFIRRKGLGHGSTVGMRHHLSTLDVPSCVYKTWQDKYYGEVDQESSPLVIRWGCTSQLPGFWKYAKVLNLAANISLVGNKRAFRMVLCGSMPEGVPSTIITCDDATTYPLVVRPSHHAQGKNLWVANNYQELVEVTSQLEAWYASELIDKKQEFRVYIVNGKVVSVAEKTPDDPTQVAWNVAQGGRFDVVNWGEWNLPVCKVAMQAFAYSGLDFGGVDVMTDKDGRPYVIEINSAPSLPMLSDGSPSYRQLCMAKAFAYIYKNGNEYLDSGNYENWRDVIHPAIWSEDT